ncbi:type I-B CRISPR-associated protein Cas5b [Thermoactinomyces sp. FSL K6-2592]|jgi:CRISPR-associated protein Cas5h|uniref:type I-B CRISPR-associated protein Cas5b n=1 Tax=Thermoactinomyces sp. FSL K6-2592 TaxID=2975347 RepID=UPI0030F99AD9
MRTLIFDLWGEWGHFRKYYSTSSPLTFAVITPTAALGVIGAILGLAKEDNEYLKILNQAGTKIGIGVNRPVKKTSMGINYINTKGNVWVPKQRKEGARSPICVEYLRDPHYRLYVAMGDGVLYQQLVDRVRNHETHYTLSLGLSELLANFRFVDECDSQLVHNPEQPVELHSIVPLSMIRPKGVPFKPGKKYKKEMLPICIDEHRVVQRYEECLIETQGKDIFALIHSYWEGNGHRFIFCNG